MRTPSLFVLLFASACTTDDQAACKSRKPVDSGAPAPPDAAATTSARDVTYALDSVLLGDVDRNSDVLSTIAWKKFGFDLDGLVTTRFSCDGCVSPAGAPVAVDGIDGIDNTFGSCILPIYQAVNTPYKGPMPHTSADYTTRIRAGAFTLQIEIAGLDGQNDRTGLTVRSFTSGAFDADGGMPSFLPTEDWPVRADLHSSPTLGRPFATAYVIGGRLVARDADVVLMLSPDQTKFIDLTIHHAILAMDIVGDSAANGTLAGVLDVEKLVSEGRIFAALASKSLCGAAFDGIAQQLRQCSDILADGTSVTGKECNAISIGIGFSAKRIATPTRTLPPPTRLHPCMPLDAGVDAADSASDQ